jgi:16S rRNA (adenine1518-N6/adenine1519-N6)-dimethyltransferase
VRQRDGASRNRPAKKAKLGQNFLRDQRVAQRTVEALGDISQRIVVEIGPGPGILTGILAQRAARVIAVELDRVLSAQLSMRFSRDPRVEVVEGNILDVNFRGLLRTRTEPLAGLSSLGPITKVDVIGNLPYYITSDILLHLFEQHELIERIVIMVQKEVADRIVARPGSRDYGLLSATAQLYTNVERLFTAPPGAFAPAPKVYSSVVRMTVAPRFAELQVEPEPFIEFVKRSFAQKRKTLVNNLKSSYPDGAVRDAIRSAGVRVDARAEAIGLDKMAVIFRALQPVQQ